MERRRGSGRDANDNRSTAPTEGSSSTGSREIYRQAAEQNSVTYGNEQLRQYYDQLDTYHTQSRNNLMLLNARANIAERDLGGIKQQFDTANTTANTFSEGFRNGSIEVSPENYNLYEQAANTVINLEPRLTDAQGQYNQLAHDYNEADQTHQSLKNRVEIRDRLNNSSNVEASIQSYNRGFETYARRVIRDYPHLTGPIQNELGRIGREERSRLEVSDSSDERLRRNIRVEALAQKKEGIEKIETDEVQRIVDEADGIG